MWDWYADAVEDMDACLGDLKEGYEKAELWVGHAHTLLFLLDYEP